MPNPPLKVKCRDCRYTYRGPGITASVRANTHSNKHGHTVDMLTYAGAIFQSFAAPVKHEQGDTPPF